MTLWHSLYAVLFLLKLGGVPDVAFAAVLFLVLFFVFRSASEKRKTDLMIKYHAAVRPELVEGQAQSRESQALLIPQRLDRIELGGAAGRLDPKKEPNRYG